MLNVDVAIRKLQQLRPAPTETETIPLVDAAGRVVAKPIKAPIDLPPFDASAMDGYALRASATQAPSSLRVTDRSLAGHPASEPVTDETAVRIFTGAVMPKGADAVLLQEDAERHEDFVIARETLAPGANVRYRGHDIAHGDEVAAAGLRLDAFRISWLAACGVETVTVTRKLRVAIFSTGDELVDPGSPLANGQIYDSNRMALSQLLSEKFILLKDLGRIPDDLDEVTRVMQEASVNADVVITSGGVSVGEADFVKAAIETIGHLDFWKIALKPGKPLAVGHINDALFFGLPGNPVSTIVTYLLFVAPTLDSLSGMPARSPLEIPAILEAPVRHNAGRREYQRGLCRTTDAGFAVRPTGDQSSNRLATFANANCLIRVPEDRDDLTIGERVAIHLLPDQKSHVF